MSKSMFAHEAIIGDYYQIIDLLEDQSDREQLMIIASECDEDCSLSSIIEAASRLNHEEFHAVSLLQGKFKSEKDDHNEYYSVPSYYSPSNKEVLTNKKYRESKAYRRLIDFLKDLSANPMNYIKPTSDENN